VDLSLKVITTEQEMVAAIMAQYKEFLDKTLQSSANNVQNIIIRRVGELIWASPEVNALLSGDLKQELGIVDARSIIQDIVEVIQRNIEFTTNAVSVVGNRIVSGGYTIKILMSDFRDILSVSDVAYVTRNNVVIPWLNWLLFAGDAPLIIGYKLQIDPNNTATSRTGAIMVKAPGEVWHVPTEYAGTQNDNFLIRALSVMEDDINKILAENI
jgi:hypothetical protein